MNKDSVHYCIIAALATLALTSINCGCAATLSSAEAGKEGAKLKNMPGSTLYVNRKTGEIHATSMAPVYYTRMDSRGVHTVGPTPGSTVSVSRTGIQSSTTQGITVDEVRIEWQAGEDSIQSLRIKNLKLDSTPVLEAQSEQLRAVAEAAIKMNDNARDAYIEQIKQVDAIVGKALEAFLATIPALPSEPAPD